MQLFETFSTMIFVEQLMIMTVILAAIASLVYAWWLRKGVLELPKGTEQMQKVWNGIREGALSYLDRQLKSIIPILAVLSFLLLFPKEVHSSCLVTPPQVLPQRNSSLVLVVPYPSFLAPAFL
ncbi:MAG: sodium/proton-translocating pyrophosphatase [Candidatus Thorarchaeota archaeon]|jgi:K(+)-stimulated pyrophosphate-energized sodium pump